VLLEAVIRTVRPRDLPGSLNVSRTVFDAYFAGALGASAIEVAEVRSILPVGLDEVRALLHGFVPAQSYFRLADERLAKLPAAVKKTTRALSVRDFAAAISSSTRSTSATSRAQIIQQMIAYCALTGSHCSAVIVPAGVVPDMRTYVFDHRLASAQIRVDIHELATDVTDLAGWRRNTAALVAALRAA